MAIHNGQGPHEAEETVPLNSGLKRHYGRFLSENPEAEDYAYFMAAAERLSAH